MINHWLTLTTIAFNAILLCLEHQQDCFCIMTTTTTTTVLFEKRLRSDNDFVLCHTGQLSTPSTASHKYADPLHRLLRIDLLLQICAARTWTSPYNARLQCENRASV